MMIDDCISEEWCTNVSNPFRLAGVRKTMPDIAPAKLVHLPLFEAGLLLNCTAIALMERAIFAVTMLLGLRAGELYGLQWGDIDLDGEIPMMKIQRSVGIHGRDGWASVKDTKTKSSRRALPIHRTAHVFLRAWREAWCLWTGKETRRDHDFVFPNKWGLPWRPPSAELLRAALKTAGLSTKYRGTDDGEHPLRFHDLRGSFATFLSQAGARAEDISALLGHVGKSVAERHYVGKDLARLRDVVETIAIDIDPKTLGAFEPAAPTVCAWGNCHTSPAPNASSSTWITIAFEAESSLDSFWSRLRDLNSRPTVYETVALPLS